MRSDPQPASRLYEATRCMQAVLKKALAYDGLARGLHEAARAIERDEAKVSLLPIFDSASAANENH